MENQKSNETAKTLISISAISASIYIMLLIFNTYLWIMGGSKAQLVAATSDSWLVAFCTWGLTAGIIAGLFAFALNFEGEESMLGALVAGFFSSLAGSLAGFIVYIVLGVLCTLAYAIFEGGTGSLILFIVLALVSLGVIFGSGGGQGVATIVIVFFED